MNFKNILCIALAFMLPSLATASVITVNIGQALPPEGLGFFDIDGDGTNDIGLAENCCGPNSTFVYGVGFLTEWQFAWLSVGQMVDNSLAWTGGVFGYTPTAPLLPGMNYLAFRNTSIGNYYGYLTIDFGLPLVATGGYSQTLVSYTYENTGAAIQVVRNVPEPTTLALLGLGLVGIGMRRRIKAS